MRVHRTGGALRIDAPCKLNLFLEVLGRRADGYHEIATVMHPVGLFDRLVFRPSREVCVRGDLESLGEANLVVRAIRAVQRFARTRRGLRVRLTKRIPLGAGLGGGSADAAAAILAMDLLHRLGLSPRDRQSIAAGVGSDVPFFLSGRTALCTGRGEAVAPIKVASKLHFVLLYPGFETSTGLVYRSLSPGLTRCPKDVKPLLGLLAAGDLRGIGKALFNRLEETAFRRYPVLRSLKRAMKRLGFRGVLMSGSGSTLYGLCASRSRGQALARRLRGRGRVIAAAGYEAATI
jgi:4-diphosphocytidyl-2-C-methyl-D-erythritol kinase